MSEFDNPAPVEVINAQFKEQLTRITEADKDHLFSQDVYYSDDKVNIDTDEPNGKLIAIDDDNRMHVLRVIYAGKEQFLLLGASDSRDVADDVSVENYHKEIKFKKDKTSGEGKLSSAIILDPTTRAKVTRKYTFSAMSGYFRDLGWLIAGDNLENEEQVDKIRRMTAEAVTYGTRTLRDHGITIGTVAASQSPNPEIRGAILAKRTEPRTLASDLRNLGGRIARMMRPPRGNQ